MSVPLKVPENYTAVPINGVTYRVENYMYGIWVWIDNPEQQIPLIFIDGNWYVYYLKPEYKIQLPQDARFYEIDRFDYPKKLFVDGLLANSTEQVVGVYVHEYVSIINVGNNEWYVFAPHEETHEVYELNQTENLRIMGLTQLKRECQEHPSDICNEILAKKMHGDNILEFKPDYMFDQDWYNLVINYPRTKEGFKMASFDNQKSLVMSMFNEPFLREGDRPGFKVFLKDLMTNLTKNLEKVKDVYKFLLDNDVLPYEFQPEGEWWDEQIFDQILNKGVRLSDNFLNNLVLQPYSIPALIILKRYNFKPDPRMLAKLLNADNFVVANFLLDNFKLNYSLEELAEKAIENNETRILEFLLPRIKGIIKSRPTISLAHPSVKTLNMLKEQDIRLDPNSYNEYIRRAALSNDLEVLDWFKKNGYIKPMIKIRRLGWEKQINPIPNKETLTWLTQNIGQDAFVMEPILRKEFV